MTSALPFNPHQNNRLAWISLVKYLVLTFLQKHDLGQKGLFQACQRNNVHHYFGPNWDVFCLPAQSHHHNILVILHLKEGQNNTKIAGVTASCANPGQISANSAGAKIERNDSSIVFQFDSFVQSLNKHYQHWSQNRRRLKIIRTFCTLSRLKKRIIDGSFQEEHVMIKTGILLASFVAAFGLMAATIQEELYQAAKAGAVDSIQTVLDNGADVNGRNILGESALMFAIEGCQTKAAKFLLDQGAEFEFHTKLGYTPLIKASALGCYEIVELLIQKKAAVEKEEPRHRFNALSKAVERNHPQIVQLLLDAGADVNYADIYGVTPLMIASQKGYLDIAELLLQRGADVTAKSLIQQTALLCALDYGFPDIAVLLINHGANVNDIDKYNRTTLMLAASLGDSSLVSMLVEKGVDINVQNDKKQTAAVIAQAKKFNNIVDFLLKSGADSTGLVFPDTTKQATQSDLYDTPPTPIGGMAAVQRRVRYPRKAKNAGLEGTVTIRVTIDRRNRVKETEVVDSFGDKDCNNAAIRAVKNTRWKAAKKGKKSVEATIEVPIEFSLKK